VKIIVRAVLSVALVLQIGTLNAQGRADIVQPRIVESMPFELTAGFLISVKGRIGDQDGLDFILDTGATASIVDRKVAMKVPITLHKDRVFTFQKFIEVERAEFSEIQFGPIKAQNVSLMVADLAKTSAFANHAAAIIGLDLLSLSKTVSIDYKTSTVSFLAFESDKSAYHSRARVPQCFTSNFMIQGHPVRLLIDTGMGEVLLYENRLRKEVPDLRLSGRTRKVHVGWVQARAVTLPKVDWKESDAPMDVLLADGPAEGVLPGIDGFLGPATLKARIVEFDFERKVLSLRW
jgi:predicted aspartyl protease